MNLWMKIRPRLLLLEHQLQAPGPILRRKVLLSLSVQCWIACALLTKRARIRKMIQILKMRMMRPRERSRRKGKGKVDLPSNHEKERKIPRCSYMHRNPSHYLQHAFTIHISYLSFSLSLSPSLSLSLFSLSLSLSLSRSLPPSIQGLLECTCVRGRSQEKRASIFEQNHQRASAQVTLVGFLLVLGPRPSHAFFYILRYVPSEAEKPWEESSHCGQRPS